MRYLVVVEQGEAVRGAHVPDPPGCVAAGDSREEVIALVRHAIGSLLEGQRGHGEDTPQVRSDGEFVDVSPA